MSSAGEALLNAYFGQGGGQIVLDDVQCTGSENRLLACTSARILDISSNCKHSEDAGVRCEGMHGCTLNKVVFNILLNNYYDALHVQHVYLCVVTVGFFKCAIYYMTQSRIWQVVSFGCSHYLWCNLPYSTLTHAVRSIYQGTIVTDHSRHIGDLWYCP